MSNSAVKETPAKEETSPSLFPSSSLPDAMALSCLALVSRSDHANLSLVSKKYRSVVVSPELYKARSLLGRTKECLYVCFSTRPNSTPSWFILRRENTKTLETAAVEKALKQLIPIPSSPSQPQTLSSFVALDWGIYVIGGIKNDVRSSDVLLLDCRTNTWRAVPSMAVGRAMLRKLCLYD